MNTKKSLKIKELNQERKSDKKVILKSICEFNMPSNRLKLLNGEIKNIFRFVDCDVVISMF